MVSSGWTDCTRKRSDYCCVSDRIVHIVSPSHRGLPRLYTPETLMSLCSKASLAAAMVASAAPREWPEM